ncbi:MAG: hypothetical protein ACE37F_32015 [Nannocystaceae bacterium]|nr:hypothetical protein [bacterium]
MSEHDELPVLDQSDLAMLAAFRAEEDPPPAAVQSVRARLLETTAVAPPTGSIIKGPWALGAGVAVIAAAAAAVLALGVGGAEATAVSQRDAHQAVDTPQTTQDDARAIAKTPPAPARLRAKPPEPVPTSEPAPVSTATPVEPTPPQLPAKRRRAAAPPPPADAQLEPASSLAAETRMLDRARKAVARKRPAEALSILDEAASRFPGGVLVQERAALRVVALCDAGRTEAGRKAAASFVTSHPRSALRTRVQSACPDAP